MLAPEGYALIGGASLVALLLTVLGAFLGGFGWAFAVLGVLVLGFTVWFFRDPVRTPPTDTASLMLSPADGKVSVSPAQLSMLLEGIDWRTPKRTWRPLKAG